MYTKEQLCRYPFFSQLLQNNDLSAVLDSLTGLVARPFILNFVHHLIDHRIPFTFAMMDLDNFKFINDTYGHQVGDGVLLSVASDLIDYLGDQGLAGRFGGDELLIVSFGNDTYDKRKAFYEGMYEDYHVLRKNPALPGCDPFITGTIGSATYPEDAADYDTLFSLIDKTLYRGKSKGRNCYIIYVESKHKNIEIRKLAGHGLYNTFHNIAEQFDLVPTIDEKLHIVYTTLQEDLRITNLYYVGQGRILRSICDSSMAEPVPDIDELMSGDIYPNNRLSDIEAVAPSLYRVLAEREIGSVLIVRIGRNRQSFGYLMCAEPHNLRIWQEDDCATMFFLARELAWFMCESGTILE